MTTTQVGGAPKWKIHEPLEGVGQDLGGYPKAWGRPPGKKKRLIESNATDSLQAQVHHHVP